MSTSLQQHFKWLAIPDRRKSRDSSPTEEEKSLATLTWRFDVLWVIMNAAFMIVWLLQVGENSDYDGFGKFDDVFMDNGFCNTVAISPRDADSSPYDGTNSPTQIGCFIFDFAMAFGLILAATAAILFGDTVKGSVFYLGIHGLAHFSVFSGGSTEEEVTGQTSITILAGILSMGAIGVHQTIMAADTDFELGLIIDALIPTKAGRAKFVAILVEIAMVAVFLVKLKKAVYVLTYVNIAINLCIMVSRAYFIRDQTNSDIHARVYEIFGPHIHMYLVTCTMMILVMWIEPTMCSEGIPVVGGLRDIGGHLWFDISLFALMLVGVLNANANYVETAKPKKG